MEQLTLVQWDDPVLTTPTKPFDFSDPPFDPIEVPKQMLKLMHERKGIGLAAPQVGLSYSLFVMPGYQENFACYNPRIVDYSVYNDGETLEEGCLSFPGLTFNVYRPLGVRVRFQTPTGETITRQFDGMTARCVQHEMQHLKGELFFQNQSKLKMDMAIKRAKKLGFNYDYPTLHKILNRQKVV